MPPPHRRRRPFARATITLASCALILVGAPAADAAPLPGYQAIVTMRSGTCALTVSGGVQCWGAIEGLPVSLASSLPVDVPGLTEGVIAITGGGNHACALTSVGGVRCWGGNEQGELGDGTRTSTATPVDVVGLGSAVASISAGVWHTCAVTATGRALCWGDNSFGQLGDGTKTDRVLPGDVSGLSSGVRAISAGGDHSCALTASGAVKCWGTNTSGQLGNGTTIESLVPTAVVGLASGVTSISAGYSHSCAIAVGGNASCWGNNHYGQLGDGTGAFRRYKVTVVGISGVTTAIYAGLSHTCALISGGEAKCWGLQQYGELGTGTNTSSKTPVAVTGLTSVVNISAHFNHSCAIRADGVGFCWGQNEYGKLGNGTALNIAVPVAIGSSSRADGLVAIGTGALVGNNIFNSTAIEQTTAQVPITRGGSAIFTWVIQNDGPLDDRFTLRGQGKSPGFVVKFTIDGVDVTASVVAGTLYRVIPANGSVTVNLTMTALATSAIGAARGNVMTATAWGGTSDTVLAKVVVQ